MKRFLFCLCFFTICVSSAYCGIFDGLFGGKKNSDKAVEQVSAPKADDSKKLGVGIDGGIGYVEDGFWWSAGASVKYKISDPLIAYGKLGYQIGDFRGRDPFGLQIEASGAYLFEVADGLGVGPGLGVSLFLAKPFGVAPELGAVADFSPAKMPISIIARLLWAPAFYFNIDSNESSRNIFGRVNFTVGFVYNFL